MSLLKILLLLIISNWWLNIIIGFNFSFDLFLFRSSGLFPIFAEKFLAFLPLWNLWSTCNAIIYWKLFLVFYFFCILNIMLTKLIRLNFIIVILFMLQINTLIFWYVNTCWFWNLRLRLKIIKKYWITEDIFLLSFFLIKFFLFFALKFFLFYKFRVHNPSNYT